MRGSGTGGDGERKAKSRDIPVTAFCYTYMVPKGGLEPPWGFPHYALNVARLPVPPLRQVALLVASSVEKVNEKSEEKLGVGGRIGVWRRSYGTAQ